MQRLNDVLEMISAANDLFTLEMIEIGGIRGRSLNKKVAAVLSQFQLLYNACKTDYSNMLEPQNPEFNVLQANYSAKVALLERKLSQIFVEAFENCNSIESGMKLSEMIGELLYRPIIQQRMVEKTKAIIDCICIDIESIQLLLDDSHQVNKGSSVYQIVWLIFNGFTLLTRYPFFSLIYLSLRPTEALFAIFSLLPAHCRPLKLVTDASMSFENFDRRYHFHSTAVSMSPNMRVTWKKRVGFGFICLVY